MSHFRCLHQSLALELFGRACFFKGTVPSLQLLPIQTLHTEAALTFMSRPDFIFIHLYHTFCLYKRQVSFPGSLFNCVQPTMTLLDFSLVFLSSLRHFSCTLLFMERSFAFQAVLWTLQRSRCDCCSGVKCMACTIENISNIKHRTIVRVQFLPPKI